MSHIHDAEHSQVVEQMRRRVAELEIEVSSPFTSADLLTCLQAGMGSSRTVLDLEDSSRTKSRDLGFGLEDSIYFTQYCIHSRCAGH